MSGAFSFPDHKMNPLSGLRLIAGLSPCGSDARTHFALSRPHHETFVHSSADTPPLMVRSSSPARDGMYSVGDPSGLVTFGRRALLLAGAVMAGCSWLRAPEGSGTADPKAQALPGSSASAPLRLPRFSQAALGGLPAGWAPWVIHPRKTPTRYVVESLDGERVLRADARSSASGLMVRVDADPQAYRRLRWRWRTEGLLQDADNTDPSREDAPVRVVLAFDGDKSALTVRDRMFFERVKLLAGVDMPYATLMYIWATRKALGTVVPNPHSARVRKLVVSTGPAQVGRWVAHERDIVADFQRVFGEAPGRLRAISVMTDTDNTQDKVTAYYGDIELLARP